MFEVFKSWAAGRMKSAPRGEAEAGGRFPIFVLGSGRSGTTLLQRILNSGPDMMIWGEHAGFLKPIAEAYYQNLARNLSFDAPCGAHANFSKLKSPENWQAWTNCYSEKSAVKEKFRGFVRSLFEPPGLEGKYHWGFKEIVYGHGCRTLDFLIELFPDARFIFVIRNPADVLASQREHFTFKDFGVHLSRWITRNRHFTEFTDRHPANAHIITYEQMIAPDEEALRKLYAWLGKPCEPKRRIIEMKEGRGSGGRGGRLTDAERELIFQEAGDLMRRFGYLPAAVETAGHA